MDTWKIVVYIVIAVVILLVIFAIIETFFFKGVKVMSTTCSIAAHIIASFISGGSLAGVTAQVMAAPCGLIPV